MDFAVEPTVHHQFLRGQLSHTQYLEIAPQVAGSVMLMLLEESLRARTQEEATRSHVKRCGLVRLFQEEGKS